MRLYLGALLLGSVVAGSAAAARVVLVSDDTTVPAATASPVAGVAPADALAAALVEYLKGQGADARTRDLEGQLAFRIDQAQSNCSVAQAALVKAAASAGQLSAAAQAALRNVTAAMARCQTGTAALADAQTIVAEGVAIGLPGGSSDYLQ